MFYWISFRGSNVEYFPYFHNSSRIKDRRFHRSAQRVIPLSPLEIIPPISRDTRRNLATDQFRWIFQRDRWLEPIGHCFQTDGPESVPRRRDFKINETATMPIRDYAKIPGLIGPILANYQAVNCRAIIKRVLSRWEVEAFPVSRRNTWTRGHRASNNRLGSVN